MAGRAYSLAEEEMAVIVSVSSHGQLGKSVGKENGRAAGPANNCIFINFSMHFRNGWSSQKVRTSTEFVELRDRPNSSNMFELRRHAYYKCTRKKKEDESREPKVRLLAAEDESEKSQIWLQICLQKMCPFLILSLC